MGATMPQSGRMLLMLTGCALLVLARPGDGLAQDWRTLARGREYAGERALAVNLEYGAGRLLIEPASRGVLYRASLRYDADLFEPEMRYADHALYIGIGNGEIRGKKNMKGGQLELRLGPQAPLDVSLKFGAAEAMLELGGLTMQNLEISTGASATTLNFSRPNPGQCRQAKFEVGAAKFMVAGLGNLNTRELSLSGGVGEVQLDFTGEWRQDMTAEISMGLGSLTLRLPRGLGVSVKKQGLLAGFDSQGLVKRGDVYYSEAYERAERKLAIELNAAFGAIKVAWVDAPR